MIHRTGTASVVFYKANKDGGHEILIGKETKFLSNYREKLAECFGIDVIKLETFQQTTKTTTQIKDKINAHFTQEARTLTRFLNGNGAFLNSRIYRKEYKIDFPIFVVYDEPTKSGDGDDEVLKTNYRFLSREYSVGVVKGGIEGAETATEAVCREIQEELNMTPVLSHLQFILENQNQNKKQNHHIFGYFVNEADAVDIIRGADSMIRDEHRGELVELRFAQLSDVLDSNQDIRGRLNQKSLEALIAFAASFN